MYYNFLTHNRYCQFCIHCTSGLHRQQHTTEPKISNMMRKWFWQWFCSKPLEMSIMIVNCYMNWIIFISWFKCLLWSCCFNTVWKKNAQTLNTAPPWASSLMYDWHIISLIRPLDLTESHPAGLCVVFNNARCILGDTCLFDSIFHHRHSNYLFQARKNKGFYIQWAFQPVLDTKQPVLVNESRMWHITSTVGLLWSSAPVVFSKLLVNWY